VAPWSKVVAHRAERLEEMLGLLRRLEPLHGSLTFTHRPMRVLGPIVQPFVPTMFRVREYAPDRRRVARQLVGDRHARLDTDLAIEHPTQEPRGGVLVAPTLHENVEDDAVLVDRATASSAVC
jgi:hypothetical protein